MSSLQRRSVRLGRPTRLGLYIVGIGVWLTGGLWLLFHYFLVSQGEFGPQTNPLEPWWLKLHGAFAFATVWMFGLLWSVHVTKAWPISRRRLSGGMMAGTIGWLTLSGYLLYYVGNDNVRSVISVLHWAIGLAAPLAFLWHRFPRWRVSGTAKTMSLPSVASSPIESKSERRDDIPRFLTSLARVDVPESDRNTSGAQKAASD